MPHFLSIVFRQKMLRWQISVDKKSFWRWCERKVSTENASTGLFCRKKTDIFPQKSGENEISVYRGATAAGKSTCPLTLAVVRKETCFWLPVVRQKPAPLQNPVHTRLLLYAPLQVPYVPLKRITAPFREPPLFARKGTWTLTLANRNLNPTCLPVPPSSQCNPRIAQINVRFNSLKILG